MFKIGRRVWGLLLILIVLAGRSSALQQPSADAAELKQSALAFFHWYEQVWDTPQGARTVEKFRLLVDRSGKPETADGYGCPCRINAAESEKLLAFMAQMPPLSTVYLSSLRRSIAEFAAKFRQARTTQANLELAEAFNGALFNLFPGNGGEPRFSASGIFGTSASWEISALGAGRALVNVSFPMPKGWPERTRAYALTMVREQGAWKLAAPVRKGRVIHPGNSMGN